MQRTRQIGRRLWPFVVCVAISSSALPPDHATAEYRRWCGNKNPDAAITACTALINSGSEKDLNLESDLKRRGGAYIKKGRGDLAARDYYAALALDPKDPDVFYGLGLADARRRDYDGALFAFRMAIWYRPKDANAWVGQGNAYYRSGLLDWAMMDFDKAISLDPRSAAAFHGRGIIHLLRNEADAALRDFDHEIRIDPKAAFAFEGRGDALDQKGDLDRAVDSFNMAIALDPNDDRAFYNRGNSYRLQGKYERAVADFNSAIALRPTAPRLTARGIVFVTMGRYQTAAIDFKTAMQFDWSYSYASMWWYLALTEMGNSFWVRAPLRDIQRVTEKLNHYRWPWPVIAMFRGEATPDQVRTAAADDEQRCEATFFSGEYQLLHGDTDAGKVLLEQSTAMCSRAGFERAAATAELTARAE